MPEIEIHHFCLDKVLSRDLLLEGAERAIAENPTNEPDLRFSPGLGISSIPRLELAAITGKKWQQERELSVTFMDGDPSVQEKVKVYAKKWTQYSNIKFNFDGSGAAEIRISFSFDPGRSWSYIGTDALSIDPDEPTMNLGWLKPNSSDLEYSRVVTHEFGHALGCIHEHQSPATNIPWDKEQVYQIYQESNGWDRATVDRNLFQKYSKNITQFSAFDPESIMLYAIPQSLTVGDYEVGWNRQLSDLDKSFIGVMYPQQIKEYSTLVVDGEPLNESIGQHGEEDLFQFDIVQSGIYKIQTGGWTDVVMTLYGPDSISSKIGFDDDSGFLRNARITLSLQPGRYYVRVRHYRPRRTGKYKISVTSLEN